MSEFSSLEEVRKQIDVLDREIVKLIAKRSACVKEAAKFKTTKEEVEAPKRVGEVIFKVRALANKYDLDPDLVEEVYRILIKHFIEFEMKEID